MGNIEDRHESVNQIKRNIPINLNIYNRSNIEGKIYHEFKISS